jgi:hypothetical protein
MLVTENLNGHAAGNGRYSQGDTYGPAVASSTRSQLGGVVEIAAEHKLLARLPKSALLISNRTKTGLPSA